jgi:hypothetical protein
VIEIASGSEIGWLVGLKFNPCADAIFTSSGSGVSGNEKQVGWVKSSFCLFVCVIVIVCNCKKDNREGEREEEKDKNLNGNASFSRFLGLLEMYGSTEKEESKNQCTGFSCSRRDNPVT